MRTKNLLLTGLLFLGCIHVSMSQDLLDILKQEQQDSLGTITPTFKMTRIAFGHSTEVRNKNVLEVFTSSRFWNLPTERSQNFIADKMSTRIALEYGVLDRLTFGVGGTTFDGLFDAYLKYKVASQKKGTQPFPVTLTLFQNASYNSSGIPNPAIADDFSDRTSFTSQLLISRKVSSDFSLQVSPTYVHKSLALAETDNTNFFAIGFGARYKLGPHLSIVSEYYKVLNPVDSFDTYGPFALGANWELGDILLQFMLTNAVHMVEDSFITQTKNNFNFRNPNLNFGFNATYVIHFENKLKRK